MIRWTAEHDGPCVIRYPKSVREFKAESAYLPFSAGKWKLLTGESKTILLAAGSMVYRALEVHDRLREQGIASSVVNCSTVKPLDEQFLASVPKDAKLFTMEEHMITGGFGEYTARVCLENGWPVPVHCFGVDDTYIQHGYHERLMEDAGLDAATMAGQIYRMLKGAGDVS